MSFLGKISEWFADLIEHDAHYTVTVAKGDSLWSIAKRLTDEGVLKKIPGHDGGENWRRIADANPDKHWTRDYMIRPGEVLKVPKD